MSTTASPKPILEIFTSVRFCVADLLSGILPGFGPPMASGADRIRTSPLRSALIGFRTLN